jgi:cell division septation protein DedD
MSFVKRLLLLALLWGLGAALQGCAVLTWALGGAADEPATSAGTQVAPTATPGAPSASGAVGALGAQPSADSSQRAPQTTATAGAAGAAAPGSPAAPLAPSAPAPSAGPSVAAAPQGGQPGRATARPLPEPRPAGAQAAESNRGGYAVQVGAFRVEASAYAIRDRVAAELARSSSFTGMQSAVRVVERGGLFRVLVGQAETASAAAELARRVRQASGLDTFVTRP